MPVESQRFTVRGVWEKLRTCYQQCKAKPYEPGITEALSLTEDYNTCVRLQTPFRAVSGGGRGVSKGLPGEKFAKIALRYPN